MTPASTNDIAAAVERIKALVAAQPRFHDPDELRRRLVAEHHDPHVVALALTRYMV